MRGYRAETAGEGQDSFLDVVANIVGILIILVMVVGVRARNAPVEVAAIGDEETALAVEFREALETEQVLQGDNHRLVERLESVQAETLRAALRRERLGLAATALGRQLDAHRDQLDAEVREALDLRDEVDRRTRQLEALLRRRTEIAEQEVPPEVLVNYPTPLSRPVDEGELHFQLRRGRIAAIPLEPLVDLLKEEFRRKVPQLRGASEISGSVGPLEGWRMDYELERFDVAMDDVIDTGLSGSYARLRQWTLAPLDPNLGEPLGAALAEGSQFRTILERTRPGRSTVTLWVYPDSFREFRELRRLLHERGFAMAARPLPEGLPITGSPSGSRSAAQ